MQTLTLTPKTYRRLQAYKQPDQTWDAAINALIDEYEDGADKSRRRASLTPDCVPPREP